MNNKKIVAEMLVVKCKRSKMLYGITIEHDKGNDWIMKYSSKLTQKRIDAEGYGKKTMTIDCYTDNDYPGCPYCGSKGYVICNVCGKMTCHENESSLTCAWCGEHLQNIGYYGPADVTLGND